MNTTQIFREHERRLFGIAYRMLGSAADAEDIVQEAFLRWQRVPADGVESPKAYLSTVVTHLAIDHLRSARVRREEYVGPWLPEPIVGHVEEDMADTVALADSLSIAFLVVLERLSPAERAAFLLREVFEYPYAELATTLEKSESACRQLVHRARKRVQQDSPRFQTSGPEVEQMTRRFLEAAQGGDMSGLMALLSEDITLWSDGGGRVVAAQKPVRGRDKVARFVLNIAGRAGDGFRARVETINGGPGVVAYRHSKPYIVGSLEVRDGMIVGMRFVVNPEKLARVGQFHSLDG